MIADMDLEKKPIVRWKTISLRGLLLLIFGIALLLGWIANKARQQREAVAALQKFGGFVHYDWEFVDGRVKVPRGNLLWKPTWGTLTPGRKPWAPDWMRRALGDKCFQSIAHVSLFVDIQKGLADASWVSMGAADLALRKLATQTSVRTLQIGGQQVTDENLSYVGHMTGLEELSIGWAGHLTDKGFLHLAGLKRLRILEVGMSKMTDASLDAIGQLTNLEELRIGGEEFSDRGVRKLRGLTRLKYLSLGARSHGISDASLVFLQSMPELEHLDLLGWHVSDDGIATLRERKNLKTIYIGPSPRNVDRRKKLQGLLPGVTIE
jgi:hypothetical protein